MIDERDHQHVVTELENARHEIGQLSERVALLEHNAMALGDVIGDVCEKLGHEGRDGDDLLDAVGQLERLLNGDDLNSTELRGIAEQLRKYRVHLERCFGYGESGSDH